MRSYSELICGGPAQDANEQSSELHQILRHLRTSIDYLFDEIEWLKDQDAKRVAAMGPFLARSLLEVGATALIGRLDPLRLYVIRRVQEQPGYDTRVAWKAAVRWQGDVLAAKVNQLWTPGQEYKDMTRALLGDYYDELLWQPAFGRFLDSDGIEGAGSDWLVDLRGCTVADFVPRRRTEMGHVYSALSKGVHPEFVMPPGALYDRNSVKDLCQRAIRVVADLSLVSHLIPHASSRLPFGEAVESYIALESLEVLN